MRAVPLIARVRPSRPRKVATTYKRVRRVQNWPHKTSAGIVLKTQNDFNLATYLGANAPVKPYVVVIPAGVVIGSSSTATAAFSTGSLPAGSTLKIINKGRIQGRGGAGGSGGNAPSNGSNFGATGTAGAAGGPALDLGLSVVIFNVGQIWGGGGGGGGGGSGGGTGQKGGGGGGGGGQGTQGGAGGSGGSGTSGAEGPAIAGNPGGEGTTSTRGAGGTIPPGANAPGGGGGDSGGPGAAGSVSAAGAGTAPGSASAGGAAGKAINLNGFSITWMAGLTSPNVEGTVS